MVPGFIKALGVGSMHIVDMNTAKYPKVLSKHLMPSFLAERSVVPHGNDYKDMVFVLTYWSAGSRDLSSKL